MQAVDFWKFKKLWRGGRKNIFLRGGEWRGYVAITIVGRKYCGQLKQKFLPPVELENVAANRIKIYCRHQNQNWRKKFIGI